FLPDARVKSPNSTARSRNSWRSRSRAAADMRSLPDSGARGLYTPARRPGLTTFATRRFTIRAPHRRNRHVRTERAHLLRRRGAGEAARAGAGRVVSRRRLAAAEVQHRRLAADA